MDGGAIDGATETPIIRGQFDSDEASDAAKQVYASMTPLGRIGQPEELAAAANFHLPWASMALAIMALGPGRLSVDAVIGIVANREFGKPK